MIYRTIFKYCYLITMNKDLVGLIATFCFVVATQAYCYNYWKGDTLPTLTNTSYCRKFGIKQNR